MPGTHDNDDGTIHDNDATHDDNDDGTIHDNDDGTIHDNDATHDDNDDGTIHDNDDAAVAALPATGASHTLPMVLIGMGTVAVGATAVVAARRRKRPTA